MMKKKLDLIDIKKFKKSKKKLVMITAYDYVSGYIVNESSADIILVGDSYGMTTLGYDQTSLVSMEDMDRATRSINNVKLKTFLVADLPYKTYETNEQALKNSKILINSGADAIKLEGVKDKREIIEHLTNNNIKVMSHIGIIPQSIKFKKDYKILGKNNQEYNHLFEDAKEVQNAGAFAVVLELIEKKLAKDITLSLNIHTICIGSGSYTDGRVQVYNDLIGYSPHPLPKHAKPFSNLFESASEAISKYISSIKS